MTQRVHSDPGGARAALTMALPLALAVLAAAPLAAQNANPWGPQTGNAAAVYPGVRPLPVAPVTPAAGSYAPTDLEARLSAGNPAAAPALAAPQPGQIGQPVQPQVPGATVSAPAAQPQPGAIAPGAGLVVPPYTGLPLAGGYGAGYVPVNPGVAAVPGGYPQAGYGGAYPYGAGAYGYPGAGAGYPAAGYGYPGTGYGYPGTGYGYPGTGYGYPGAGAGYPGAGYGYPGAGAGYPGAGYGYPGAASGYPGTGFGTGMPGLGNGFSGFNGLNGLGGPSGFGSPIGGFSPFGFW